MKIVTHNSGFHTDDIFAVATLLLLHPDAEVIRTRDERIIESADIVVDVGMIYDPSKNRYDHHQPEGAGERENAIPYASFGLVWKEFGKKIAGGEREAEFIDRRLVQPIDAHDNGVAIAEYKFREVREYVIGDFLNSFIESREESHLTRVFMNNLKIAGDLLKREIATAKKVIAHEDKILLAYNASPDKRLVIVSEELMGLREVLGKTRETLYLVHPRPDGKWTIGAVPDSSKPYGNLRKPLPASWAGKKDEELQKITGVEDALFAHRKRFMASAKSREGAIALAKIALNA